MVNTTVPVVFAVLHLLLFLFYRRAKENLYYALFTLMLGAWLFVLWQFYFSQVTGLREMLLFMKLNYVLGPIAFIAGLRFLYALFYPRLPKQFWIFLLIGTGFVTWHWGHPLIENYTFIFLTALEMLRVAVAAIMRKKDGAWIIGTGFIFFTLALLSTILYASLVNLAILPNIQYFAITSFSSGIFGLLLSMSVFLARNISRTEVDNTRKTQELEEARKLQLSMLPKELPQLPHLEIGAFMKTATEVGGDYYDFHLADNGTLTVAIGDATGHGMQAGTMVAATKSLFNALADEPEPIEFLKKCTKAIKAMGLKKMFMALTIAKFKDHHMQVAAAGMPFTLIYRVAIGQVEEVVLKGMPLGGLTSFPYKQRVISLAPGDTVLLLSDGFPELFNDKNEMLDYPRVKEIFKEAAESPVDEIVTHLFKAGERWSNGRPQDDDITFVVLKVKGAV